MTCRSAADGPSQRVETDANTAVSVSRQAVDGDCCVSSDYSDILDALDRGDLAVLTLLDLSAAFDTVHHRMLIRRLDSSYGIRCTVVGWFSTLRHACTV